MRKKFWMQERNTDNEKRSMRTRKEVWWERERKNDYEKGSMRTRKEVWLRERKFD